MVCVTASLPLCSAENQQRKADWSPWAAHTALRSALDRQLSVCYADPRALETLYFLDEGTPAAPKPGTPPRLQQHGAGW